MEAIKKYLYIWRIKNDLRLSKLLTLGHFSFFYIILINFLIYIFNLIFQIYAKSSS